MKAKHPVTLGLVYVAVLAQTGCNQDKASAPEFVLARRGGWH
jgi:hypothetical protein